MDIAIQYPLLRRVTSYSSHVLEQFFGEGLFDHVFSPFIASTVSPYYRHSIIQKFLDSSTSGISEVKSDKDRFMVYMDVKHFSPEELNVKVAEDYIEIHGRHGEKQDDHGYISQEFHRRYLLPSNVDQSAITCTLSGEGLLTIFGPKSSGSEYGRGDRNIPLNHDDKSIPAPSS